MQATGGVMPPDHVVAAGGDAARVGPDRRRHGRGRGGASGRRARTSSPSTWAARASTCASCAAAAPEIRTDRNWRYRYYIGVPMVDVQSIGAGGGSIARVREGALLVGPESAGSSPGPACYGRGGDRATVTDADAVLGFLPVDRASPAGA